MCEKYYGTTCFLTEYGTPDMLSKIDLFHFLIRFKTVFLKMFFYLYWGFLEQHFLYNRLTLQ